MLEPDPAFVLRGESLQLLHADCEPVDVLDQNFDDGGDSLLAVFKLFQARRDFLVVTDNASETPKSPHDGDMHLHGAVTIEARGRAWRRPTL